MFLDFERSPPLISVQKSKINLIPYLESIYIKEREDISLWQKIWILTRKTVDTSKNAGA